jgi:hypothetical protein
MDSISNVRKNNKLRKMIAVAIALSVLLVYCMPNTSIFGKWGGRGIRGRRRRNS